MFFLNVDGMVVATCSPKLSKSQNYFGDLGVFAWYRYTQMREVKHQNAGSGGW